MHHKRSLSPIPRSQDLACGPSAFLYIPKDYLLDYFSTCDWAECSCDQAGWSCDLVGWSTGVASVAQLVEGLRLPCKQYVVG